MTEPDPKKLKTNESEMDTVKKDIRIKIREKRFSLYNSYYKLKNMAEQLKEEIDSLADIEWNLCDHKWVRDLDYYEPCGPRPFICKNCGMCPK